MRNEVVDEIVRSERLASLKIENAKKEAEELVKETTIRENLRLKNFRVKNKAKLTTDTQKYKDQLERRLVDELSLYKEKLEESKESFILKYKMLAQKVIKEVMKDD